MCTDLKHSTFVVGAESEIAYTTAVVCPVAPLQPRSTHHVWTTFPLFLMAFAIILLHCIGQSKMDILRHW
jgi:hypothetical protein